MSVGTITSLYSADGVHQVQLKAPDVMTRNANITFPDGGSTDGNLSVDATGNFYANVALTPAQILTLATVPVVVAAAPGAGKFIEFVSGMISYTFSVAAYTAGGNVSFGHTGQAAESAVVSAANSFGNAASQIWTVVSSGNGGGAAATYANLGLTFRAAADFTNPGTAAGTARIAVVYRIHTQI